MTFGRAVASVTASLAVAGCAVVAVGMSHSGSSSHRTSSDAADRLAAVPTSRPAFVPRTGTSTATATPATTPSATHVATTSAAADVASPAAGTTRPAPTTSAAPTSAPTTAQPAPSTTRATRTVTRESVARTATTHPVPSRTAMTHPASAPATTHSATKQPATTRPAAKRTSTKGRSLPLGFSTGSARKVITVVAHSHNSTTATLQAWSKVGSGWTKHGQAINAHVGTDGLTKHASESRSATPIGSFTLTRAFGRDSDPGTSLPYVHTTPSDWWISQPGKLYNTLQECSSHCSFNQGSPNEHLYYETPYYDYAVVIDYNTRNAPGGVHQGKGSAFFLHVHPAGTAGTAGCVDIPKAKLVNIMRWLTPQSHARILIGVR